MVAHLHDAQGVRGSSPLRPTAKCQVERLMFRLLFSTSFRASGLQQRIQQRAYSWRRSGRHNAGYAHYLPEDALGVTAVTQAVSATGSLHEYLPAAVSELLPTSFGSTSCPLDRGRDHAWKNAYLADLSAWHSDDQMSGQPSWDFILLWGGGRTYEGGRLLRDGANEENCLSAQARRRPGPLRRSSLTGTLRVNRLS